MGWCLIVYAFDHAELCMICARELRWELLQLGEDVRPVFHIADWQSTLARGEMEKTYLYCHPSDKQFDNIKDFKFPHREI